MSDTHLLESSVGIRIEGHLDPATLELRCQWLPEPPYPRRRFKRLMREYIPWRNAIIQGAVDRVGKSVLVVTPTRNGRFRTSVIKPRVAADS
jgi:hypothetical protein